MRDEMVSDYPQLIGGQGCPRSVNRYVNDKCSLIMFTIDSLEFVRRGDRVNNVKFVMALLLNLGLGALGIVARPVS